MSGQDQKTDLDVSDHRTFLSVRSFGSLDGLRAFSILAVLWHHAALLKPESAIAARGFLGVDLFFVISGFLIPTLLLREQARWGRISLLGFYWRRLLRIFPPYYLVLAAYAALFAVLSHSERADAYWRELPFYLTYTSNWIDAKIYGISWSLACEQQFYLILPLLLVFLGWRALLGFGIAFLALNQAVNFGLLDSALALLIPNAGHLEVLQTTFTPIVLGVFLAFALNSRRGFMWLRAVLHDGSAATLVALAVVVVLMIPNPDISGLHRLGVQVLMVLLVAACVVREDNGLARLLKIHPLHRLGRVSYGIYLYHLIVLDLCLRLVTPNGPISQALLLALTIGLSWLVAELSFRVMEAPIMRLRKRFGAH